MLGNLFQPFAEKRDVTTEMIEVNLAGRKKREKMLDGLSKQLNVGQLTCSKSNKGSRCVEGLDCLHQRAGHLID